MKIQGDLHSHSAFAGGARGGGKSKIEREKKIIKRFHDITVFSPLKGVELLGTGDIQFEWWNTFVKKDFIEDKQCGSFVTDLKLDVEKIQNSYNSSILKNENFDVLIKSLDKIFLANA